MTEQSYVFVSVWREVYAKTGQAWKANEQAEWAVKAYKRAKR